MATEKGNSTFKTGDKVLVDYRLTRQPKQWQFILPLSRHCGTFRPRMGLSDGHVPATVTYFEPKDFNPKDKDTWAQIRYEWPVFCDERGHFLERSDLTDQVQPRALVAAPTLSLPPPAPCDLSAKPALGLLIFRWGGRNEVRWPDQWGETGSPVSDTYVKCLIEQGVGPVTKHSFEAWTVYVDRSEDLQKFVESAQLVLAGHPVMRCEKVAAMYFLYPTMFEENCTPFVEVGTDDGAAFVHAETLLSTMRAVEKLGIQTGFPHPSDLYEILAGKTWTFNLSLAPQYQVPATVRVQRYLFEDPQDGARTALAALHAVLAARGQPPTEEGVCKLGFSWEALDVKHFKGVESLVRAMTLTHHAEYIDGNLCGQAHRSSHVIMQEYVQHDLELRAYVVEGVVEEMHYTRFERIDDAQCFKDFKETSRDGCVRDWFRGDEAALKDAETQVKELVATWLTWLRAQCCETPPAVRFDFFVRRKPGGGAAQIWTAEICEVGFSMFESRALPSKVFKALIRALLRTRRPHAAK